MHRLFTYAIIAIMLALMLQQAYGFSASPLFSGISQKCTQVNASYIACPDGYNITLTFSLSAPYAPYYGNFTIYPTDFQNESMPVNIYGRLCSISSSSTVTCFMSLRPIPLSYGNGTLNKRITLLLVSSNYPQVRFLQTFNISINHYLTSFGEELLALQSAVNSSYNKMSGTYFYFCNTYQICNSTLASSLANAKAQISNASAMLNSSNLNGAYAALFSANAMLQSTNASYNAFVSYSNNVTNAIIRARYLLANETRAYDSNRAALANCTFRNGTKYSSYINSTIAALSSYPMTNTEQAANAYLNMTESFGASESRLIAACPSAVSASSLPKIEMPRNPMLVYVLIIIIAIFGIYMLSRVMEARTIEKIRGSPLPSTPQAPQDQEQASKEDLSQQKEPGEQSIAAIVAGKPEDAEEAQQQASPLESSFDKWFESTIKKHQDQAAPAEQQNQQQQQAPKQSKQPPKQGAKKKSGASAQAKQ